MRCSPHFPFGHVADKVVVDLAVVEDDYPAAAGAQQRIDPVEAETSEPVTMLHDEPAESRIRQRLEELPARAVESRANRRLYA